MYMLLQLSGRLNLLKVVLGEGQQSQKGQELLFCNGVQVKNGYEWHFYMTSNPMQQQ